MKIITPLSAALSAVLALASAVCLAASMVVEVLELIFGMDRQKATRIMLEVHTQGKGVCGVYTYEIAETKVAQVTSIAQQQQHPLLCTMEEA